jgi:L-aspartate oxidase
MEFIQFHPTALFHQGTRMFLISEAMRGYGAKLINSSGETFMEKYDSRKELAPRDIVSRAIDLEIKKSRSDCVYLDITHIEANEVRSRFPKIAKHCKETLNLDIAKSPIPVVPAAHYLCGGIMTSLYGQTSMQNLYACGEVAHTGIHGANRLASNSLIEGMVFSYRAATKVINKIPQNFTRVEIPDWDETGAVNRDEWFIIRHNLRQIQDLMWDYVGIVRSKPTLERSFRRVKLIYEETEDYYRRTKLSPELLELRNMSAVAYMIILSALRRKESRGCHFMDDHPESDKKFLKDTII